MCRVEDVSTGGACVVTSEIPDLGETVKLDLPGIGRFVARIAHISGDRVGVAFIEEERK